MLGSAGPQIIITVAVELIAMSIEQIIDIATAKPKLEAKLRIASAAVDIGRMLQTDEGDAHQRWTPAPDTAVASHRRSGRQLDGGTE